VAAVSVDFHSETRKNQLSPIPHYTVHKRSVSSDVRPHRTRHSVVFTRWRQRVRPSHGLQFLVKYCIPWELIVNFLVTARTFSLPIVLPGYYREGKGWRVGNAGPEYVGMYFLTYCTVSVLRPARKYM